MIVYVGQTFNAARTGTAVRQVQCEKCGCDYCYRLFRRGVGQGTSPYYLNNRGAKARAERAAEQKLRKLLVYGVDPVACPDCGWLQAEMVKEIQRRKHRWLIPLAICLTVLFALASFLFWMISTHDFNRDLNGSDEVVLVVLIAAAIGSLTGPLLLRRWLLKRNDPNRNHPQRPDPIPGAPKPFRPGEEGVLDALPADAPEQSQLTYQSSPPEVEPGGWITAQLALWPLPRVCCSCLCQCERVHLHQTAPTLKLPIRLCPQCQRSFRAKKWMWMLTGIVLGAVAGYLCTLPMHKVDEAATWILGGVGVLLGWGIAAALAHHFGGPARFSRFNGPLNTIRVRFSNPDYIAVFVSEPPPTGRTFRSADEGIPEFG